MSPPKPQTTPMNEEPTIPDNKGEGRNANEVSASQTTENSNGAAMPGTPQIPENSELQNPNGESAQAMEVDDKEDQKEEHKMDGNKKKPFQYSPVPPPPSVDEETLKRRAAEARAYALSGTSRKKNKPATIPAKPTYNYGRYPPYAAAPAPDGRARAPPTTNPHHPHQPYPHHPPPPHYYYPPPPSHPHAPPYPYYPPPYGYHYPPPPPPLSSSATGTKPTPATAAAAAPAYPPPPPYPYTHAPPPPAKGKPPKPESAPAPAPTATTNSTTGGSRAVTATTPPKNSLAHTISLSKARQASNPPPKPEGMEPLINLNPLRFDDEDDDYVKFVRSLGLNDAESVQMAPEDDDEEDFLDDDDDDEDDDDEEEDEGKDGREDANANGEESDKKNSASNSDSGSTEVESAPSSPNKKRSAFTLDLPEFDPNFYRELEDELGGLEEEDLEAAIASLLGTAPATYAHAQKLDGTDGNSSRGENISSLFAAEAKADEVKPTNAKSEPIKELSSPSLDAEMGTPLRNATGMRTKTMVTAEQVERLQTLLNRHYQTLVQQAVLAIQAAHLNKTHKFRDKTDFLASETADDLVQVLDAAVGMVQDLDQNRKDAIRNAIQLEGTNITDTSRTRGTELFRKGGKHNQDEESHAEGDAGARRLTRAAFTKTLQQHTERSSVFNVKGLHRLQETFHALDRSIGSGTSSYHSQKGSGHSPWYTETCREMLKQAGADYEDHLLPGSRDLSEMFSTPKEYLGEEFQPPCSQEQERFLRRFRSLFTSGEDNLVLRGVNLYGEKQWILIADRYLPDRSINNISQRYSKLCVMLYKAQGIHIDSNGNLETPPKLESVEDIDDEKVALIKRATAPAILNVHRWSLEEDLTLLKAVPLMGHMWAELGARLIPHRDRGHLRKRYQVLERRVKATVSRYLKGHDQIAKVAAKMQEKEKEQKDLERRQQRLLEDRPSQQQQQQQQLSYPQTQPPPVQPPPVQPPPVLASHVHAAPHMLPPQNHPVTIAVRGAAPPTANHPITASGSVPPKPAATRGLPTNKRPPRPLPTAKKTVPRPLPFASRPAKKAKLDSDVRPRKESEEEVEWTNADSSRAAIEELVNEENQDWSQMSRIQEMMENEVESEIVDTLASRMSKSDVPPTRKSARVAVKTPPSKTAPSILTSVLERANSRAAKPSSLGAKRKNTLPTTRTSKRLAAAAEEKKANSPPAMKSPLLTPRATRKAETGSPLGGSPDVNSALFAEGNGTLDGFSFEVLESRGASQGLRATDSYGSNRSKISAHDMEAISALNSLSNSPALAGGSNNSKRKTSPGPNTRSRKGNEEDKSFFAKITGRVKDRDSKRKRRLNF